jgi:hypothetical protein
VSKFDSAVEAETEKLSTYCLLYSFSMKVLHKGRFNTFYFNILSKEMALSLVSKKESSGRREGSSIYTYVHRGG